MKIKFKQIRDAFQLQLNISSAISAEELVFKSRSGQSVNFLVSRHSIDTVHATELKRIW
jgi:hypothetical protein